MRKKVQSEESTMRTTVIHKPYVNTSNISYIIQTLYHLINQKSRYIHFILYIKVGLQKEKPFLGQLNHISIHKKDTCCVYKINFIIKKHVYQGIEHRESVCQQETVFTSFINISSHVRLIIPECRVCYVTEFTFSLKQPKT